MQKEAFAVNEANFSEIAERIRDALAVRKVGEREIGRAALLFEELFFRARSMGVEEMRVTLQSRLGDLSLHLSFGGEERNPLANVAEFAEDDVEAYRTLILRANRDKLSYERKNGENVVTVAVHSSERKQIYCMLAAMVLGFVFGELMKTLVSPETVQFFDETVVKSVRTVFLNALSMMIAPVVFFSIINGVTNMTDTAELGRLGGKLIGLYMFTTVVAAVSSIVLGYVLFSGDVPQIGVVDEAARGTVPNVSLLAMIVGVVPKNLIDPIVKGDMLQIIFMAVAFGICITKLGDSVRILVRIIDSLNRLCLRMVTMIAWFIPLIAFLSMASLIFHVGLDSLLFMGRLILGQLAGSLLMLAVYSVIIRFVGGLSPFPFLRKIPSFIPIPMALISSNATMPFTMKFCTAKLGISSKLSSFSIPIGSTINMDGVCFYLSIGSIMMARLYGIELTEEALLTLLVTVIALSVGAPGVPGGVFVCFTSIIVSLGIPIEAASVLLAIESVCAMIRVTQNILGDIAMTSTLAGREKLLDETVYAG